MTTTRGTSLLAALALAPALLLAACTSSSTDETTLAFIELVPRAVTLPEGGTRKLTVIATYSDGSILPLTTGLTFSSSEAAKATVSADGTITAVAAGAATIVATASGRTATCAVTVNAPTLQSIAVTPATVSLEVGATQALTVTGTYDFGPTADLTGGAVFSTLDGTRASVSAAGVVTAIATGQATITATFGGKVSTAVITILAPTLQSIAVTPASLTLPEGATRALAVTGTYSSGPTQDLTSSATYASSDETKATVSAAGVVTAVAPGPATITATVSGRSSSAAVTVTARALQSIAVAPATVTLTEGTTRALTVTGTYDIGPTADLTASATYTSSDEARATVSAAGVVTAVAPGPATITATFSGRTSTAAVTVNARVLQSIAVAPAALNLVVTGTGALAVTATYDAGPPANVTASATYVSSDETKATVSAAGLVTAVAAGSATITASFSGQTATATVTVSDITTTGGRVFFGDYEPGVSFAPFGGSTNDLARDTVELNPASGGRASLRVVVPNGNYTGGAFVTSVPRDLRAFNAVTFWAKASSANPLNVAGLGDNAASNPPPFSAEVLNFPLTGTWTKFVVPLPDPSKLVGSNGLFHFAEAGDNYTIWFSDIQYESLGATDVAAPTGATVDWPALTVAVDTTSQLPWAPNTVSFTTPSLPTGGSLKNVGFAWYTLSSSNTGVATVSPTGLVRGVAAGAADITASMNGLPVAGNAAITVTAPLAVPGNIAPTPTVPAADVISLFSSAYTNRGVDTWRTSWSAGNNELVDPYVISGHDVKQYTLHNFVGVEFGIATPANTVDASTMTHFHVDLWSPNPPGNIEIQLVNEPGGAAQHIGLHQAGTIATGSWVSLDIPLSSFTGLTSRDLLRQLLFVASGPTVLYVDNVYFHR